MNVIITCFVILIHVCSYVIMLSHGDNMFYFCTSLLIVRGYGHYATPTREVYSFPRSPDLVVLGFSKWMFKSLARVSETFGTRVLRRPAQCVFTVTLSTGQHATRPLAKLTCETTVNSTQMEKLRSVCVCVCVCERVHVCVCTCETLGQGQLFLFTLWVQSSLVNTCIHHMN